MSGFVKIAIDDYYSDNNWTTIINKYWIMAERVADPRVQGWVFFDTPLPTVAFVLAYLAFVMIIGPMYMTNKKPYKIQKTLIAYNAFQVALSLYMFYEHLMSGWWGDYSLTCQPVDYSDSDKARRMLQLCWVYYFSKLSEFADTVFFVLRKKKNQITWLHLYHHSLTPFETWILVKFVAGGQGTLSNIINNLVHAIMYFYYMVAAMGPEYYKYLKWKKYITIMQLIQFFIVLAHSASALVHDCGYPKSIAAGLILHSTIFIGLFSNFYIQAYKKKTGQKQPITSENNNNNNDEQHFSNGVVRNGEVKNGVTNGYLNNGELNGRIRNGEANGYVRSEPNGHIRNGHLNGVNGVLKVNGYLTNGYTNGSVPSEVTDKEKVQ